MINFQFRFQKVHGLKERGAFWGLEFLQYSSQGCGGSVEPLLNDRALRRSDGDHGTPAVGVIGTAFHEARSIQIGEQPTNGQREDASNLIFRPIVVTKNHEIGVTSETVIDRSDFGMSWNQMGASSMKNTITLHAVFRND